MSLQQTLGYSAPITAESRAVDDRLFKALAAAGRSPLGMPGTVDTMKQWLAQAGLKVVLA